MRALPIGVLALVAAGVAEALPHRPRLHANASLTIYSIAEGPDGFLWLGTSDGLYRFDGFHYHKIPGYPFPTARFVAVTEDGSVWGGGLDGLARSAGGRFETVLRQEVQNLAAFPGQLFVRLEDLVRVGLDGSVTRLKLRARRDLTPAPAGRLWMVCMEPKRACSIDPERPDEAESAELKMTVEYTQVLPGRDGRLWAADDQQAVLLDRGRAIEALRRLRSFETTRPGPLVAGRSGQIWFLGEAVRGLTRPVEFRSRADDDRFSPISGIEDRRGRLWVASKGRGLVEWTADPGWQRWYPEHFGHAPAVLVVREPGGGLILGTHTNVFRFRSEDDGWTPLFRQERRYEGLLPLEGGEYLAAVRGSGLVRLSREGAVVERIAGSDRKNAYREIVRDAKQRVWVGAKDSLFRLEGKPGSLRLKQENLPGVAEGTQAHAVDLEVDGRGRLWVGYNLGIARLDEQGRWNRLETDRPVMWLRSFAPGEDEIWAAHRRAGSFSRLRRRGGRWEVTQFTASGGYGPPDTHFLKRDSRGWIWRGTPEGVFVCDGAHTAPEDWLHFRDANGLAGDQTDMYGFHEDAAGNVWIAGAEGVTRIHPDRSWFEAPRRKPALKATRVEADGRGYLFPASLPSSLPADTKTLKIDLGSMDAPPFRDYAVRYRLIPGREQWRVSRNGRIEFENLAPNSYTLEAGFADGSAPAAVIAFRIGTGWRGPWSWLWPAGLLLAAGAFVPALRYVPWIEGARFRIEKAIFVLRRRYARRRSSSPQDGLAAAQDHCGETLMGRYRLGRIVSRGGFSVVYEARDLENPDARLAVKVLNQSSADQAWVRNRFAHEVAALRSLQHPGVVPVLDSWISPEGEPCLAMPFLDGQTLRAALDEMPFTPARAARIVRQVGAALAEAHGRGIIHRDLKPENLMLVRADGKAEQAVIIDFGTAGLRSAENQLAATTLMSGSFHYMAPERLTGHYSAASDVFSLGVIVFEMLTGRRLSDLPVMFSDPDFARELENALRPAAGAPAAKALAAIMSPAFDTEPRRRPGGVRKWAEEVASALDQP